MEPDTPTTYSQDNYTLLNNYLTNIKLENSLNIATIYAEYILKGNDPYIQIHSDALIDIGVKKLSYGMLLSTIDDDAQPLDPSSNTWTFKINIGNADSIFEPEFTFTDSNNNKIPLLVYFNNNVLKLDSSCNVIGYERYDTINKENIQTSEEFSLQISGTLPSFLDNDVYETLPKPYTVLTDTYLANIIDNKVILDMRNEILFTDVFDLGIEIIEFGLISLQAYDINGIEYQPSPLSYDNTTGLITYNQNATLTDSISIKIDYDSSTYVYPLQFTLVIPEPEPEPEPDTQLRYSIIDTNPDLLSINDGMVTLNMQNPEIFFTDVFDLGIQNINFNEISLKAYDDTGSLHYESPLSYNNTSELITYNQDTTLTGPFTIEITYNSQPVPVTYKPPLINGYEYVFDLILPDIQQNTELSYSFTDTSVILESVIDIAPLIPTYNTEGTLITNVFNLNDPDQGYTFDPDFDTVEIEFYNEDGSSFTEQPPIEIINNNYIRRARYPSQLNFKLKINVYKAGNPEFVVYNPPLFNGADVFLKVSVAYIPL
jgi:hypothetical protein